MPLDWLVPVVVIRQCVEELHAISWGVGPQAFVTPNISQEGHQGGCIIKEAQKPFSVEL